MWRVLGRLITPSRNTYLLKGTRTGSKYHFKEKLYLDGGEWKNASNTPSRTNYFLRGNEREENDLEIPRQGTTGPWGGKRKTHNHVNGTVGHPWGDTDTSSTLLQLGGGKGGMKSERKSEEEKEGWRKEGEGKSERGKGWEREFKGEWREKRVN